MRGCRMGGEGWRVFDGLAFDARFPFYIPRGIVDEDWNDERLNDREERICTNNNTTHHATQQHTAHDNIIRYKRPRGRKPEGIIQHTHTRRLRPSHFTTPRREPGNGNTEKWLQQPAHPFLLRPTYPQIDRNETRDGFNFGIHFFFVSF